jgi:hypothetical protein
MQKMTIEQQRRYIDLRRRAIAAQVEQQRRKIELQRRAIAARVEQQRRKIELQRQALAARVEQQRRRIGLQRKALAGRATRTVQLQSPASFRLPKAAENQRLIAEGGELISQVLAKYAEQVSDVQHAMDRMRTPWLDTLEAARSVAGFAGLQGMGHALGNMPAYSDALTSALRTDLGDWRDGITWTPEIFSNLATRKGIYISLGFDEALTSFPAPAFEQGLRLAGLKRDPPPLVDRYGPPVPPSVDKNEENSLARTNLAHDWLLRLETHLRQFMDKRMTRAFGTDWAKHRLPNGLYEKWQEKKRVAQLAGAQDWPLIAYADFTDYEPVICKRDNWREVFAAFFGRQEGVRESFQRLYPVRLDTMHARPITQDDQLLLYVETRRLVRVTTA